MDCMIRHNDMMMGFIMGLDFMFLISEHIMTCSSAAQSQSAALVNKWPFQSVEEEWSGPLNLHYITTVSHIFLPTYLLPQY